MMEEIFKILESVNKTMSDFGYKNKLVVGNDYISFNEKEVTINMPYTLSLKIPREKFDNKDENAIKDAVNQAMSQAISSPVSQSG